MRPASSLVVCALLTVSAAAPAAAQTFRGRVLGSSDEPVVTALVRLEDSGGTQVAFSLSDTLGAYRLSAPEPGEYVVVAERLGYEPFRSALLAVGNPEGTYPVDIVMRPAPIGLGDIVVTADRLERVERGLHLAIGLNPRSLRVTPIFRTAIQEHLDLGHDLTDMVRWSNIPSIVVRETTDGPCYQYRNRGCLPVYFNGQRMNPELIDILPLELAETVVFILPKESIEFEGGAVLLYSASWIVR